MSRFAVEQSVLKLTCDVRGSTEPRVGPGRAQGLMCRSSTGDCFGRRNEFSSLVPVYDRKGLGAAERCRPGQAGSAANADVEVRTA